MANTKVQSEQIEDGSITADKIADGAIVATELADNAVTTAKINADAVTGAKIADDAINSEHYTDGSIDTAHIADSQITVAKMAANSVDSDQFVDGSIDTVHIADSQVTTAKIADGNISTAKIADNAVTSAKVDTNIDIAGTFDVTGATTLDSTLTVAGDANFDSGTLFVDVSTDKVGIGTTAPDDYWTTASNLVVKQSSGNGGISIVTGTSEVGQLYFADGTTGDAQYRGWLNYSHADDKMALATAASIRMTILSDGKVGIGTTSPSKTFHVYNTAAADVGLLESTQAYSTLSFISSTNASTVTVGIDGAGNAAFENKLSSGDMTFVTNGSERMRIEADGKVGIGTNSPTLGKVEIDGGSTGGRFDALTVKHGETNTTGDGPAIRFEGYYSGNSWALAEMSATNGGAGYGANFSIDMHPGGGTQSSATVPTFSLIKTHEGIVRQKLNAQTFTLAANAQETFTDYCNTTALVNIASQRNGSNSIIYTGGLFYMVYSSSVITEIADVNDLFLTADTSAGAGKICIYKGNASATFYIVNRTSYTMTLSVHVVEMLGN